MAIVHSDYLDDFSTSAGTSLAKIRDGDGKVWLQGTYTNDGVDNTPMQVIMCATGYSFIDLADGTDYIYVGVPDKANTSGATGKIQIGGHIAAMIVESKVYTAGHAVKCFDGTAVTTSAAYDGNAGEFAAVITTGTAAAAVTDAILNPEAILETT